MYKILETFTLFNNELNSGKSHYVLLIPLITLPPIAKEQMLIKKKKKTEADRGILKI